MQTNDSTITARGRVIDLCAELGIDRSELNDCTSAIRLSWDDEDVMVASALESVKYDYLPYRDTIQYPDDWAAEQADSATSVYTAELWSWLGRNYQAIENAAEYLATAEYPFNYDQIPSLTQYAAYRVIFTAIIDLLPEVDA